MPDEPPDAGPDPQREIATNPNTVAFLSSQGVSSAEIEQAAGERRLGFVLIEQLLAAEPAKYDLREMAEATGSTIEFTLRLRRAMGQPDRPDDEPQFTDSDLHAQLALQRLTEGLPLDEDDILERTRVVNAALARIGEVFAEIITRLDELTPSADDLIDAIANRIPIADEVLENARVRQLRLALQRRLAGLQIDSAQDASDLAIGFADLVGFTPLSRHVSMEHLTEVITHFEEVVFDAAASHDAHIVKTIGDEVLLSTADPVAAAEVGLSVIELSREDAELPKIRVGLDYGPVLSWHGDRFGPTVNQANRLVNVARPSTAAVGPGMRDALRERTDRFHFRSLGTHRLKGIGGVRVWKLSRRRDDKSGHSRRD